MADTVGGSVEVAVVDRADEAALRRWWQVGHDSCAGRPSDPWPPWEVSRVALPAARTDGALVLLTGTLPGREVPDGAALAWSPLLEDQHLVEVDLQVRPGVRRRGLGAALLAALETGARAGGRTTVTAPVATPPGAGSPGLAFAEAAGYTVASAEETKTLDLLAARPRWPGLLADVADRLGDLRVDTYVGAAPEAWADDLCALLTVFGTMVPTGELDVGPQSWTTERLRAAERRRAATGRTAVTAVALTPAGRLVGFSEAVTTGPGSTRALVGGTLVLPEHRGRRLGLALKLATHQRLLEAAPGCRHVDTGNAGVNAAMNAVNDRLGYRVVERSLEVQRRLTSH